MALAKSKKVEPGSSVEKPVSITEVTKVYSELVKLLEEYAPTWYTEELHNRAVAGLHVLRQLDQGDNGANRGPAK